MNKTLLITVAIIAAVALAAAPVVIVLEDADARSSKTTIRKSVRSSNTGSGSNYVCINGECSNQ